MHKTSIAILLLLSMFLVQSCHYKIRSVKKDFYPEQSSNEKEQILRKKIAAKPYVFLLFGGEVFQVEEASLIDGKFSGKLEKASKWMYPIPGKLSKKNLSAELEQHGHFDRMIYLKMAEKPMQDNFVLDWEEVKGYVYYK